jgi:hypothetical protein
LPDGANTSAGRGLNADEVRALHSELRSLYAGRNAEYQIARDRYSGQHWGDSDNPSPDGRRYTITLNYIRTVVDKTVQLLLGQMPGIQVMPPGVDMVARRAAEKMEALLYATWDKNSAELVFRRLSHNAALLRRGILYYWWDPKDKVVRFRSVAPDNFYPVYDGEEFVECVLVSRRLTRVLQRLYPDQAKQITSDNRGDDVFDEGNWTRVVGGQADVLGTSGPGEKDASMLTGKTTVLDWYDRDGNWTRVMGDAVHTQKLAYGFDGPPVIEFPNSLPGDEREPRGEIEDILDLVLYADQLISQQADIIKRYANPTIIDKQSGQGAQMIRQTVQGDGGVLPIKRDGAIELLNWTGTAPDINSQYARVLNAIYDISGKPASSYGQLLSNQSGVATNMALSPASSSTEEKMAIFGLGLIKLNEVILRLNEKFMKGEAIEVRASAQKRPGTQSWRFMEINMKGIEIGGWYKNRIKWPSTLRTDDPIYVQNELAKASGDSSNPPKQSLYTTLENLGVEDVEAEIDRIQQQLEDPRLHPAVMTASANAAAQMSQSMLPQGMEGLDPGAQGEALPEGADMPLPDLGALEASGSPDTPKSEAGGGRTGDY